LPIDSFCLKHHTGRTAGLHLGRTPLLGQHHPRPSHFGSGQSRIRSTLLVSCMIASGCQPGATTTAPPRPPCEPGGPYAAGSWPPGCWRPYADTSVFYSAVSASPRLAPNSDRIVARIINSSQNGGLSKDDHPNNLIVHTDGTSGEPTYYSQATDPEYTLRCTMVRWGVCPLEGLKIRVPEGAQSEGNRAAQETNSDAYMGQPDAHLTVVDQQAGWEYDLWQVHRTPIRAADGPEIRFSWGGMTRLLSDGRAADDLKRDPVTGQPVPGAVIGDATAARYGSLAGRIRAEEFADAKIDHALLIVVNCDNGAFVYPARKSGRRCSATMDPNDPQKKLSDTDAPPMGTRLQLNMSPADIDALANNNPPVPKWKVTLLQAIAKYGMFIGDTGSSGYFGIETEAGNQYTSVGAYPDKWKDFAASNAWPQKAPSVEYPFDHFLGNMNNNQDGIDWKDKVWKSLRVVTPSAGNVTIPDRDPSPPWFVAMDAFTTRAGVAQPVASVQVSPYSSSTGSATLAGGETITFVASGEDADSGTRTIQIWVSTTTWTFDPATGLGTQRGPELAGAPASENADAAKVPGQLVDTGRFTSHNITLASLRGHNTTRIRIVAWAEAANYHGGSSKSPELTLEWGVAP
jgi:hypothetical protein